MNKKALIAGGIVGLILPFIGIFLGLQVSVTLGNILAFPVVALAAILDKPFGTWPLPLLIFSFVLSSAVWALIFGFASKLLAKK